MKAFAAGPVKSTLLGREIDNGLGTNCHPPEGELRHYRMRLVVSILASMSGIQIGWNLILLDKTSRSLVLLHFTGVTRVM